MADKKKDKEPPPIREDRFGWTDDNVGALEWEDAPADKKTPPTQKKGK